MRTNTWGVNFFGNEPSVRESQLGKVRFLTHPRQPLTADEVRFQVAANSYIATGLGAVQKLMPRSPHSPIARGDAIRIML